MSEARITLPHDKGWARLGPGGGGSMYHPTISPHDPRTAVVCCDMTGQYITRDAGSVWHMSNLMISCDCFAFDPVDPRRLYAGANALYVSDDFGDSWGMLWPGAASERQTHLTGDEASPVYHGEGWPGGRVTALAIDPSNNSRLLAGVSSGGRRPTPGGESAVYLSEDRGRSWRPLSSAPGGRILRLYAGAHSGAIWALTTRAFCHSADGGRTWRELAHGGETPVLSGALGFDAKGDALLYVVSAPRDEKTGDGAGLFVSPDGGESWRNVGAGVERTFTVNEADGRVPVRAVAICRDRPQVAYLSVSIGLPQADGSVEPQFGIAKTIDAGETWQWAMQVRGEDEPGNYENDWLTDSYTSWWPGPATYLGVAPTDPDICYATDSGRCYMTGDGGALWRQLINHVGPTGDAYTRGLDVTTCYGIHFDPHHPDVAFISYTDIGLHKSADRGLSWRHAIEGAPRPWRNTCYWLVFDPDVPNKVWSVWSGGHDYPRLKMFRSTDPRRYRGGVCISQDNGDTWRPTMEGMPEVGCTQIVLDPTSPAGQRTLYVTAFGRGVYKSVDDGASWKVCNAGLPEENLNAWWLSGDPAGAMYLSIARTYRDGCSIPGGVYRTTDGAGTWERLPVSDDIPSPNDVCVAPDDPSVLYVAAWPVTLPDRVVQGGVYRTADGGRTCERLSLPAEYVYAVTIDASDGALYATTWHHGIFRSENHGQTWSRLGGASFGWPHRIFADPFDPESVYLTTFGGSLWHGPKRGTPGAGPDIVDLPPVTQIRP